MVKFNLEDFCFDYRFKSYFLSCFMLQTYIGDAAHATLLEVAKECMYHEIMHYEK
jgi:hypothetical protein